jgi:hypothetical protein
MGKARKEGVVRKATGFTLIEHPRPPWRRRESAFTMAMFGL